MKTIVLTVLSIMGLGAAASAQDAFRFDPPPVVALEGEERIDLASASDQEPISLPRSLASTPVERADEYSAFSLGIAGGYLNQKDADKGTWFGGVQARLRMGIFAVEGSIQFHQNKYQGGDVVVTQYPVQVTAFLYFIPTGPIRPYILGGVGWYYTRVDYKGVLSGISDDTQHIFGEHLGAGAEFFLSPRVSLDADVRYIFLNPSTERVIGRDFNYWQITAGVNFFF